MSDRTTEMLDSIAGYGNAKAVIADHIEWLEARVDEANNHAITLAIDRDRLSDGLLTAEQERMRLQNMIHTLSGQHPDAAEMLFRERKLNETLLEMKEERDSLRAENERLTADSLERDELRDKCSDLLIANERLRSLGIEDGDIEAALDELDTLRAEVDRLREYHDRMEKWNFPADVQQASYDRDQWKARAEAAEAENERLLVSCAAWEDDALLNAQNRDCWKARAEAAERVVAAVVVHLSFRDFDGYPQNVEIGEALAAWEATR